MRPIWEWVATIAGVLLYAAIIWSLRMCTSLISTSNHPRAPPSHISPCLGHFESSSWIDACIQYLVNSSESICQSPICFHCGRGIHLHLTGHCSCNAYASHCAAFWIQNMWTWSLVMGLRGFYFWTVFLILSPKSFNTFWRTYSVSIALIWSSWACQCLPC